MKPIHKPFLFDAGGDLTKRWFVFYYANETGEPEKKRVRVFISSRCKTREERYREADRLKKEILESFLRDQSQANQPEKLRLVDALAKAMEYKESHLRARSLQSYRQTIRLFLAWLRKAGLQSVRVGEFSAILANQFIQEGIISRRLKPKSVNGHISYMKAIFTRVAKITGLTNPFFLVDYLKEEVKPVSIWDEESRKAIAAHLRDHCPELFRIVLLVYHGFLRPAEIMKLTRADLDLVNGLLRVPANASKSRKTRYVTLSAQLIKELSVYSNLEPATFLFSEGLKPGPISIGRNNISERFKREKRALGLPEGLKLYHFKHTGNSEMVDMCSLRELCDQNGHSSMAMTERYIQRITGKMNPNFREKARSL
jgi:integrase